MARAHLKSGHEWISTIVMGLCLLWGCAHEERDNLHAQVQTLKGDLARSEQHVGDLKVRIGTIRARNKVLVGLVQGLTSDPDTATGQGESAAGMGSAQQALATLDADIDMLALTLRKSRDELDLLRNQRKTLRTNLTEALRTIEDARSRETQAQARYETFRRMLRQLRDLIETDELQLQVVHNRMMVQLPESLMFDTGREQIKPEGKQLLKDVAAALKQVKGREFQVAGHTDDIPIKTWRFRSNWSLSGARAIVVTRYLIDHGVPQERISAAAYADTDPMQPNDSSEHRAMNRRIEIVLLPALDELPDLSALDEMREEPPQAGTEPTPAAEPATAGAAATAAPTPTPDPVAPPPPPTPAAPAAPAPRAPAP